MTTKIIDNNRLTLADAILEAAPKFKKLAIATGYWDLPGFHLLKDALSSYESVRILIGQEPLPPAYAKALDLENLDETFPEAQMKASLAGLEQKQELREAAKTLKMWIAEGRVEVRIFRGAFLHAKAYILGDGQGVEAIGIIGSSNFTSAGLTRNLELNASEDDFQKVTFTPANEAQPHGHLSWFNSIWDDPKSELWNGKFTEILEASPMGDLTFSQYHMYIKALYEIYSDELVPQSSTGGELEEILYSFQLRNSKLLLNKLARNGVAMLADSVGLGKTITAGAVIKTYIDDLGANRVYVIAPASLTGQWKTELAEAFGLVSGFEVISMQDVGRIREARELDKYAGVDLFVIDEAHNLRSGVGARFEELQEWFSDNPDSHVLLLTATPINNSLKDIKSQIQLGAKGKLQSFPVVYPTEAKIEVIDFYEAIDRLNGEIKRAVKANKQPDYNKVNHVMRQGLRHFLVRTTRKGIEKEFGGVKTHDGKLLKFPTSEVVPTEYSFSPSLVSKLNNFLETSKPVLGGHSVHKLNVDWLLDLTQRAEHPLDSISRDPSAFKNDSAKSPFESIFQCLLLLGFAPYKSEIYKHKFLGKDIDTIRGYNLSNEERFLISSQLSIHNMLRVTLLKRLESSQYALRTSLENYKSRITQFTQLLDIGKIAKVKDLSTVLDLFDDSGTNSGEELDGLEDYELQPADPKVYDLDKLRIDLKRDLDILKVLLFMCQELEGQDDKLAAFANLLTSIEEDNPGTKVLVFSYYADTIKYLREKLASKVSIPNFAEKAGFTDGQTKSQINDLAKRFSPISKKANPELLQQGELQYLLATDVLSEGQNLQDCGLIVNFDLHWNPVRMIQRNGRINRLGSQFAKVQIFNMHPDQDLNAYLSLVERLQLKIEQINNSIGNDQSILGEDANPIDFVDIYDPEKASVVADGLDDDSEMLSEDEFVIDLREFEANASESDRRLVKMIGEGKWGYLPTHGLTTLGNVNSLSLVRIQGQYEQTSKEFKNYLFVKSHETFGVVETFKALQALKVPKTALQQVSDTIHLDRDEIAKKARQVAKIQAKKKVSFFRFTPTVNLALDRVLAVRPDLNFVNALQRVHTVQAEKRGRRLVRAVNASHQKSGSLSPMTIADVEAFIQWMSKYEVPTPIFDEQGIRGVLHFAK